MIKIRLAELNIELHPRDAYTEHFCADYRADFDVPDLIIDVPEAEVVKEQKNCEFHPKYGYAECICIYRQIALALPRFGGFVFHASVVEYEKKAFAFAARSGTGKSTHAALWLERFGPDAKILNGDKPIFRLMEGQWYAFGTPWCGKERQGYNGAAPLKGICFLKRAKNNTIGSIGGTEMISRLFTQVLTPKDPTAAELFLDLLVDLHDKVPCYLLACNMEKEAAEVACFEMNKENRDDSQ